MNDYKNKYLKYKNKYLKLKQMYGGRPEFIEQEGTYTFDEEETKDKELILLVGFGNVNMRNRGEDIFKDNTSGKTFDLSRYRDFKKENKMYYGLTMASHLIDNDNSELYVFNVDFNDDNSLIKLINYENKFDKIIFDWCVFKFMEDYNKLIYFWNLLKENQGIMYIELYSSNIYII